MITIHGTLDDLNKIMGGLGEITPQMFATMNDMPITTYEDDCIGHITNINIHKLEEIVMNIYNEYSKPLDKTVTVYEYNADDEDPDCMRCVHVCDSRKLCDECGAFWINYLRREYIDEDTSNEGIREIYK